MDRSELAAFLRRRREEVAALAAMSTDYYTRLEQQRGPQPSEQLLARALRLSNDEGDYLLRVAGRNVPSPLVTATHVAPALQRVLDRLPDTPALVLSSLGEVLVQNQFAEALYGDAIQSFIAKFCRLGSKLSQRTVGSLADLESDRPLVRGECERHCNEHRTRRSLAGAAPLRVRP